MRKRRIDNVKVYIIILMACVFSQSGVAYFKAPSFQLILGVACFPIFKKLWNFSKSEKVVESNSRHSYSKSYRNSI